jgi:small ligand-binding sensory domain FIST
MKCAGALSTVRNSETAIGEVLNRVAQGLGDNGGDLAFVFASAHHGDTLARFSRQIRERRLAKHVLGCTGESIIGEDREVEGQTALSLWAIQLPGATLKPIRLEIDNQEVTGVVPGTTGTAFLLGDPFSFPADVWLKRLRDESPHLQVIGGMASAAQVPRQNRLVLDDVAYEDGAVAILVQGPVAIQTVVSQGCRPIGRPMIITKADRNLIQELGRRPAVLMLREVFDELSETERERVRQGLHVGRVINEYQDKFDRGDFLVRNVIGADESGGIAITDLVRIGQTVQFHMRDAEAADEDLRSLLETTTGHPPVGALLFSCNGRGSRMFSAPDHDVGALRHRFGPIPVAGFFAMGEIGPVGGQNFVHGFTASVALFGEAR